MSDATTFGQFAANSLIAAKAAGKQFHRHELATELDSLLTQWNQSEEFKLAPDCPRTQIPPTPEAVTTYAQSIGYPIDGRDFCDSYAQKGWIVGKTKMKDWQAAVRNWKNNGWGKLITNTIRADMQNKPRDYSKI